MSVVFAFLPALTLLGLLAGALLYEALRTRRKRANQHPSVAADKRPAAVAGKRWAVVQDLRPFLLRVEGRHRTERAARLQARRSAYWVVMPLAYVEAENARLRDDEEVIHDASLLHGSPPMPRAALYGRPAHLVRWDERTADLERRIAQLKLKQANVGTDPRSDQP